MLVPFHNFVGGAVFVKPLVKAWASQEKCPRIFFDQVDAVKFAGSNEVERKWFYGSVDNLIANELFFNVTARQSKRETPAPAVVVKFCGRVASVKVMKNYTPPI
jgi:hypothetical protein